MLGRELSALAENFFGSDKEIDITDEAAVLSYVSANKPDMIINCAAYTDVDKAEAETELNYKINAIGPEILAKTGLPIMHISTDYAVNPVNAYGKAKAEGEERLAKANPNHWIIRTAWLYGAGGKNFVKSMLNLMRTKEQISVVSDQRGNPTWTYDLAKAMLKIAENPKLPGIYNFTGEGTASWHEFAMEIQKQALEKKLLNRAIPILPISSSEWKSAAKRPLLSALDKTKIKENFDVQVPAWQNSLFKYLDFEK